MRDDRARPREACQHHLLHRVVAWGHCTAPKRAAEDRLNEMERETISRGLSAGATIRAMARALNRAPSTVSREVARNGGAAQYRALDAMLLARRRAKRPKLARLVQRPALRTVVEAKRRANWSPAQISGWLVREFPETMDMRVSHETIYRSPSCRRAAS